jgi:hypothetical protein
VLFGLEVKVYTVRTRYDQKPNWRKLKELYGAEVAASPSPTPRIGRPVLAENPESLGSLGMVISEVVEDTLGREDTAVFAGLRPEPLSPSLDGDSARRPTSRWRWPGRSPKSSSAARVVARTSPA